jgi:hypothetical protein
MTAIVVVSAAVRIALGHRMVAPWIMIDEIVYSELAKSFAAHASFLVRGVPSHGYGFVYPIVIAPAYRLFASVPDAYAGVKAINAVLMSLAAVPAYFIARRVLPVALALVVAVLTVAVPSMLYTGTIMTENVFYPLFLVAALAVLVMLERPTAARQVGVLVLCLLAFLVRQQAVALVIAAATAPVLLALVNRESPRRFLRAYATLYGILAGGVAIALLDTVARGRSVYSLLGAYRAATNHTYTVGNVGRYFLWHVAELDLFLGVIPFAALLAMWLAPRAGTERVRAFTAGSFAIVFWLVLEVAAFASEQSQRIEERNMFYVAPLFFVALLGLAARSVVTHRRSVLLVAGAVAAVLPAFIPFPRLIGPPAVSDTFALLPWWWIQDHWVHLDHLKWVALVLAAGAAVLVFVPRRLALVLPALVAAYFVFATAIVENGRHGIHVDSVGSLWAGIRVVHPDWIDRAVGHHASVDYLWSGVASEYSIWENEFFSRSMRRVYNLAGNPGSDPLTQTPVVRGPAGTVLAGGRPVRVSYLLADGSEDVAGRPIAADPRIGVTLYRVDGPIILLTTVTGLYPNDTWSGKRVTYSRLRCGGGRLTVSLGSDASLYATDQVVTASEYGAVVSRTAVPPTANAVAPVRATIPLASRGGRCAVVFTVARTKVPGHGDSRPLGAHFLGFVYHP